MVHNVKRLIFLIQHNLNEYSIIFEQDIGFHNVFIKIIFF